MPIKAFPKYCVRCKQVFPPTREFWSGILANGEPHGDICKSCIQPESKAAYELEQLKKRNAREALEQLMVAAEQNRTGCLTFAALTTTLLAEFGDAETLCHEWASSIRAAKPGSPASIRGYEFISKMVEVSGKNAQRKVEELTDKELQEDMAAFLHSNFRLFAPEEDVVPTAATA